MNLHPLAGKPAPRELLTNIPRLLTHYFTLQPDPRDPQQRVSFGTSGHRGSSDLSSFNEAHILAITQAICEYRAKRGTDGVLFIGMDTHALSEPAMATALEVLAANGVETAYQRGWTFTPTPVISHAILTHNRSSGGRPSDGIVITPSHNPPSDGGFKYNPPEGGPASAEATKEIQNRANQILEEGLTVVRRLPYARALRSPNLHEHDFIGPYVDDLAQVVDVEAIRKAGLKIGADPLGGAALPFWEPIAEKYKLDIQVVNRAVDPTFGFMTVDRDGKIRMDCSSPQAMAGLIAHREKFDISFGNDPDGDRHGIVTRSEGLLPPNNYLAVAIWYLFQHRPGWSPRAAVGKTLVSSSLIDRVAQKLGRPLSEVPVGFKWFVNGLLDGSCGFGGEESAGASFLRRDGQVWTTDKDGIILNLLAAEITAVLGKDPAAVYHQLEQLLGSPLYERIDAPANAAQKKVLSGLTPDRVSGEELAGEPIEAVLTRAPANDEPIGGLKVVAKNGWFAARPSGTEDVYKIYAESFLGPEHLKKVQDAAVAMVSDAFRQAGV